MICKSTLTCFYLRENLLQTSILVFIQRFLMLLEQNLKIFRLPVKAGMGIGERNEGNDGNTGIRVEIMGMRGIRI